MSPAELRRRSGNVAEALWYLPGSSRGTEYEAWLRRRLARLRRALELHEQLARLLGELAAAQRQGAGQ